MSDSEENAMISITVITHQEKKTVKVQENSMISVFKEVIAKHFNSQPSQLRLIFGGKIMKDQDTLSTYKIKDGLTVHLVIKINEPQIIATTSYTNTESSQTPRDPADINTLPFNVDHDILSDFSDLQSMEIRLNNLREFEQHELSAEFDFITYLSNIPEGLQFMSYPTLLEILISTLPYLEFSFIERYPEYYESLQNSSNILPRELRDQIVSSLETLFGTFRSLQIMYVEEPFMNAETEDLNQNTFATPSENGGN